MGPSFAALLMKGGAPVSIARTANPATIAATGGSGGTGVFSSQSIGAASADRIVVLCLTWESSSRSLSSVSNGFGAMTIAAGLSHPNDTRSAIYYRSTPTGTTDDFVVIFDGAVTEVHGTIYAVRGADAGSITGDVDDSLDMDSSSPLSMDITIPLNGGALAVACCGSNSNAKTWTNITEDIDEDAGAFRHTTAFSTTSGAATITCQGTSSGENGQMACVVFSPAS